MQRRLQLKALIQQCFDIFNVYGKEPEAAANIIQAYALVLEPYHMDFVTKAFHEWLRTSSAIPAPADIMRLTQEAAAHDRALKGERYQPAEPLPVRSVPWALKNYKTIMETGLMPQILRHIRDDLTRAQSENYIKYLRNNCDFPADFVQKHGVQMPSPA